MTDKEALLDLLNLGFEISVKKVGEEILIMARHDQHGSIQVSGETDDVLKLAELH